MFVQAPGLGGLAVVELAVVELAVVELVVVLVIVVVVAVVVAVAAVVAAAAASWQQHGAEPTGNSTVLGLVPPLIVE